MWRQGGAAIPHLLDVSMNLFCPSASGKIGKEEKTQECWCQQQLFKYLSG
eukprot:CAMPEP_0171103120 /NCGR_PEP_ID=MMETSP0766_2-20121228/58746_1 /TAXON_ID=439317 /ORGANISM="Gambierdiscus australes, Strain CAWD 149" /LENGTH=49 /DNA_ID= /DNA_START= /DNA_END= /DNA_ORIENTATION=